MAGQSDTSTSRTGDGYVVVARRYRPQLFDQLVGQEQVAQALTNAIKANRTGHAYLFTGARGVGKTSTARIFAKALNCVKGPTPEPCNQCDICQSITSGEDVDVLEIDGASNRGVDEIRQLRSNVGVRPSRSRFKIYIIDEVHMLTREAFNALLKTLEEPPDHVKFIFCTTDPEKIPITVLSRCQRFDFAPVESSSIFQRLQFIAESEGVEAEPKALQFLARQAGGSMRDSQSLLEQLLAFCSGRITLDDVHALLGTARSDRLEQLVVKLSRRDTSGALAEVDAAIQDGVDAGRLAEQLIAYYRDMMTAVVGCNADMLLHCAPDEHERLKQLGQSLGLQSILALIQIFDQSLVRMRQSAHTRTLLEMAVVRAAQLEDLEQLAALVEQVRQGAPLTVVREGAIQSAPAGGQGGEGTQAPAQKKTSDVARQSGFARSTHVTPSESPSPKPRSAKAAPPSSGPPSSVPDRAAASGTPAAPRPSGTAPAGGEGGASGERAATLPVQDLWKAALGTLEDMTADFASYYDSVETSGANTLVVSFRAAYNLQKQSCERPERRAKIEQALADVSGRRFRVEFRLMSDTKPPDPQPRPKSQRQLMKEAEKHPFVRQALELFDGELVRLKPPRPES